MTDYSGLKSLFGLENLYLRGSLLTSRCPNAATAIAI